jgi:hypothetical protein
MYGTAKSQKTEIIQLEINFATQPETEAYDISKKECRNTLKTRRSSGKT